MNFYSCQAAARARSRVYVYVYVHTRTHIGTYVRIYAPFVFESDYGTMARDGSAVVSAPPAKRTWRISFPGPLVGLAEEKGALSL